VLRARNAAFNRGVDRLDFGAAGPGPMLVQVFAKTTVPTETGKFFACHPVTPDGTEAEGSVPTFSIASETVYVLVVGPRVPVAGDMLIAKSVNGRWVAASGKVGCPSNSITFRLTACLGAGVPGATVEFWQDGSLVYTGSTASGGPLGVGNIRLAPADPGDWEIKWSAFDGVSTYAGAEATTVSGVCESRNITKGIAVPSGWACTGCLFPLPPLFITDDYGTRALGDVFGFPWGPGDGCARVSTAGIGATQTTVLWSYWAKPPGGPCGSGVSPTSGCFYVPSSCTRPIEVSGTYPTGPELCGGSILAPLFSGGFTIHE